MVCDEVHGCAQILIAGRPRVLRREPVFDVDADHAVARCEQHDVVVEGAARRALAAADHATAVDKHQHRPAPGAVLGDENIDYVARITAVFHVAQNLDAGVGLLFLQRRVERCGFCRIGYPADGGYLVDELGWHLRPRGTRRHETAGGNAEA